ncbi:hypothetical protein FOZ62_026160, partial [Perkinsus olseni]
MVKIDEAVADEFRRERTGWLVIPDDGARRSGVRTADRVPVVPPQHGVGRIPGSRRGTVPLVSAEEIGYHMALARAPSTNRKRGYTIRNYEDMCLSSGLVSFPVSGQSLTAYIVGLTKKALKYETVTDYVGTVKLESRKLSDYVLSQMENEQVRLALQAAKRLLGNRSTKRTVTLDISQ